MINVKKVGSPKTRAETYKSPSLTSPLTLKLNSVHIESYMTANSPKS